MALDLTALEAEATRNTEVDDSAVLIITALLADVELNKGNPAAIQAVVDKFRNSTDKLAAAVAANTPGGPVVPPGGPGAPPA